MRERHEQPPIGMQRHVFSVREKNAERPRLPSPRGAWRRDRDLYHVSRADAPRRHASSGRSASIDGCAKQALQRAAALRPSRFTARLIAALALLAFVCASPTRAQEAPTGERYALLIGGLGGTADYERAFQEHLLDTRRALTQEFQFPAAHVTVLAAVEAPDFVGGVSTAEAIEAQFDQLAARVTENDDVYVVLFGHGSYDGQAAYLNIPGRDLSAADYATLVDGLDARRLVFINTASASAPFIGALSAPGRVLITATRTGTQRNATSFPTFMVEALANGAAADRDKDGTLSVREVFTYASDKTAQSFEETGNLATERALLEDTGDGRGHAAEQLQEAGEGALAAATFLRRSPDGRADDVPPAQRRAQEALRREIAELQGQKEQLGEEAYYDQLETLFVRLARLNSEIENREEAASQ